MKVKEIFNFIDSVAPFKNSLSFDNTGLLVGNMDDDVKKVLLSLDITNEVIQEAMRINANVIISHHPVIFRSIKSINFNSPISYLCKNKINAICAHTNLDVAAEGVNFHLSKKLQLSNLTPLTYEENLPIGLIGTLNEQMTDKEFANHVKKSLECESLRYTNCNKKIKKVAVCSGTGGEFFEKAFLGGADALVTGEIKHSQIISANSLGIMIVDAGHFKTENVIIDPLKSMLQSKFPCTEFISTNIFTDNIHFI